MAKIRLVNEVILDAEFEPGTEHEGPGGDLCRAFGGEANVFVCAVFFGSLDLHLVDFLHTVCHTCPVKKHTLLSVMFNGCII